ncbi:hypothetical protein QCA50_006517 [Cerrena zonata]|uniref:Uncharacterized protein n=1 Tax=Cerrena zonata TaxID=2478898 RepID=A0AAW0G8W1_9APHY
MATRGHRILFREVHIYVSFHIVGVDRDIIISNSSLLMLLPLTATFHHTGSTYLYIQAPWHRHTAGSSKAAGLAGCYQWGLDAGDHHNRWNPYADRPFHWAHVDIPEFDDELFKRGQNYIEEPEPISEAANVPRPKPRQKARL